MRLDLIEIGLRINKTVVVYAKNTRKHLDDLSLLVANYLRTEDWKDKIALRTKLDEVTEYLNGHSPDSFVDGCGEENKNHSSPAENKLV